jgi:hypothetical protein
MYKNNETEITHEDIPIIFLFTLSSWGNIQRRRINYNPVIKYFNMIQL